MLIEQNPNAMKLSQYEGNVTNKHQEIKEVKRNMRALMPYHTEPINTILN